jgi:hypothetical protein
MNTSDLLTSEERILEDALTADGLTGRWAAQAEAMDLVAKLHQLGAHICTESHDPLPVTARARHGDPHTSKLAALTVDNMNDRQMAVLTVAEMFGEPFTYDDLIWRYDCRRVDGRFPLHVQARLGRGYELPAQEPSSIRSRCAELRRAGFIVQDGRGESYAGRPCNTWAVA